MEFDKAKIEIEQGLGWGDSENWNTKDYEALSAKIHERTGVTLSVATLKRLWGKVKYDSKPTTTTLNTLAQYLGYESWRSYCVARTPGKQKRFNWAWALIGVPIIAAAFLIRPAKKVDASLFTFSSKKIVDIGVPNTVVFDYDATAASEDDSIFVQQSWDKRLSKQVRRDQKQHTSVYYYPGFFEAKLVIDDQIVKEHNLLIKTDGWLPLIEQPGTPIYFKQDDVIHDGILQLPMKNIQSDDIPWTAYYLVQEFDGLMSDDVVFETSLKNDYNGGSNPCQYAEIRLQFEGPAVIIPLSSKGCVSTLAIADTDGTRKDLSAFGCDFSDWVNVRCVIKDKVAEIFVNNETAIQLKVTGGRARMVEVGYRFQGTGSVDFVKLTDNQGKVFYEEDFNE